MGVEISSASAWADSRGFDHAERLEVVFDLLSSRPAGRLLDLGAGHGKFSLLAHDLGWQVTAIDGRGDRFPTDLETSIEWVVQDVRHLVVDGTVDMILNLGLLYHLDLADQLELLRRCSAAPTLVDTHAAVNATTEVDGWKGAMFDEDLLESTASIGNRQSFWPIEPGRGRRARGGDPRTQRSACGRGDEAARRVVHLASRSRRLATPLGPAQRPASGPGGPKGAATPQAPRVVLPVPCGSVAPSRAQPRRRHRCTPGDPAISREPGRPAQALVARAREQLAEPDAERLGDVRDDQAINDALRESVVRRGGESFQTATASMGRPLVDLDRALQLSSELEDREAARRLRGRG